MRLPPTLHASTRSTSIDRPADEVWAAAASARGDAEGRSWYVDNLPFAFRGGLDRLALGRGRRWPLPERDLLEVDDRAGFWEVVEADHAERRLAMTAAVRAPGTVLMEVSAAALGPRSCVLTLAISFAPRGVLGVAYLVADLPAREVVIELTHRRLLEQVGVGVATRG